VDPVSQLNTTILSNNDESAVAGLLALGTSTNDTMGPDLGFPTFSLLTPSGEAPTTKATTPLQPPTLMMACSLGQSSQPSYHNSEASPSETIDLLRHYRYEVAPWVSFLTIQDEGSRTDMISWTFATLAKYSELQYYSWPGYPSRSGYPSWPCRKLRSTYSVLCNRISGSTRRLRPQLLLMPTWTLQRSLFCAR
jgi:hypothetical protein